MKIKRIHAFTSGVDYTALTYRMKDGSLSGYSIDAGGVQKYRLDLGYSYFRRMGLKRGFNIGAGISGAYNYVASKTTYESSYPNSTLTALVYKYSAKALNQQYFSAIISIEAFQRFRFKDRSALILGARICPDHAFGDTTPFRYIIYLAYNLK